MSKTRHPHGPCLLPPACEKDCDDVPRELPHYFTGRVLTARDLRDEQGYVLSRLRLRNRLFHGWGVVCGLDVCSHPDPACRDRYVVVEPGIAIDCCGNDIFVCEPCVVEIPPLPKPHPCEPDDSERDPPERDHYGKPPERDLHGKPHDGPYGRPPDKKPYQRGEEVPGDPHAQKPPDDDWPQDNGYGQPPHLDPDRDRRDPDRDRRDPYQRAEPDPKDPYNQPEPYPEKSDQEWGPYVICLQFVRHGIEPRPVLDDPCGCDVGRSAPTRTKEGFRIHVVPHDGLGEDCWPLDSGGKEPGCGCRKPEAGDCFVPACPCDDCVPLALLTRSKDRPAIRTIGRPEVVTTLRRHTRIARINWPHGATIPSSYLREEMGGRLEIGFTAPLAPSDPDTGTGISRFTFEVTFSGVQRDVEFLPTEDEPYLSEDGCTAYYPIDKGLLRKIEGLGFRDLRVRLRGDFVLDTDGHPIDADFLRGRLPSGNGTAGGTFESWLSTRN